MATMKLNNVCNYIQRNKFILTSSYSILMYLWLIYSDAGCILIVSLWLIYSNNGRILIMSLWLIMAKMDGYLCVCGLFVATMAGYLSSVFG